MISFSPSECLARDSCELVALLGFRDADVARNFLVAVANEGDANLLIRTLQADWGQDEHAVFERFYRDPLAEQAALLIAVSWRRLAALKLIQAHGCGQSRLKH